MTGDVNIPMPVGGSLPPPPPSLCKALMGEEEEQRVKDWCKANKHDRGDFFEERLAKADELREEANALFKGAQYDEASTRYLGAIWQLDYEPTQQMDLQEREQTALDTRKLKVISNLCGAFLKMAQHAESLEESAPSEEAECFANWEDAPEGDGLVVEDPIAEERAALAEARKNDPDIIDYSAIEEPLKPKLPMRRKKLTHKERKIQYFRLVKTTADIGLKHIDRMGLTDNDIRAKFNYRVGIAEFERGFSEPAYEAFKKANELLPGDKEIRQALAKARGVVQEDRASAKEVWRGKLASEDAPAGGLKQWLVPRQLIGWVGRRVAGTAPADDSGGEKK